VPCLGKGRALGRASNCNCIGKLLLFTIFFCLFQENIIRYLPDYLLPKIGFQLDLIFYRTQYSTWVSYCIIQGVGTQQGFLKWKVKWTIYYWDLKILTTLIAEIGVREGLCKSLEIMLPKTSEYLHYETT
jgi:hypothetical protein